MRPTGATTDNLVLRFRPVFVSAIEGHTPPPPADDVEEIVSFLFESIDLTYVPQALSGVPGTPIQATWDQVHNTPTFAVG